MAVWAVVGVLIGGALLSLVLGIAGRRRRFEELSVPRFAAWGALGGLLLSLLPAALFTVGWRPLPVRSPGSGWPPP